MVYSSTSTQQSQARANIYPFSAYLLSWAHHSTYREPCHIFKCLYSFHKTHVYMSHWAHTNPLHDHLHTGWHKKAQIFFLNMPSHSRMLYGWSSYTSSEPKTHKKAQKDTSWQQVIQCEISTLHANQTWTLVPSSSTINLVTSKWVLKVKTWANGFIERYKAWLVA